MRVALSLLMSVIFLHLCCLQPSLLQRHVDGRSIHERQARTSRLAPQWANLPLLLFGGVQHPAAISHKGEAATGKVAGFYMQVLTFA